MAFKVMRWLSLVFDGSFFLVLFLVIQAVLFGAQLTPWGQSISSSRGPTVWRIFCAQLVALVDSSAKASGKVLRKRQTGLL